MNRNNKFGLWVIQSLQQECRPKVREEIFYEMLNQLGIIAVPLNNLMPRRNNFIFCPVRSSLLYLEKT